MPCWNCRYCDTGNYHMCQVHSMYGFKRAHPGGMEEFMVLSTDSLVHTISKDIPPSHAAFAEPLSCALHAVERADDHASPTPSSWRAAGRSGSA